MRGTGVQTATLTGTKTSAVVLACQSSWIIRCITERSTTMYFIYGDTFLPDVEGATVFRNFDLALDAMIELSDRLGPDAHTGVYDVVPLLGELGD